MPEYTRRLVERIAGHPGAQALAPRPAPSFAQPEQADPFAALGPPLPATPIAPARAAAPPVSPIVPETRRSTIELPGATVPLPRDRPALEPPPASVHRDAAPTPPRTPGREPVEKLLPLPPSASPEPPVALPAAPQPPAPPRIQLDLPRLEIPIPRVEPRIADHVRMEAPEPVRREASAVAPPRVELLM